jgi:hypothetical protein
MNTKYIDEEEFSIDEDRPRNITSLRQESDFYHDEDNIVMDMISVKRIKLPKNGEDWEVIKNKKSQLILRGIRFTNKEKEFLRTPAGISFILNGFKQNWFNISNYKKELKKYIK